MVTKIQDQEDEGLQLHVSNVNKIIKKLVCFTERQLTKCKKREKIPQTAYQPMTL